MHNLMTDLAIQRVQHLVGMKGARQPSEVDPPSVIRRMGTFGLGTAPGRDRASFMRHVGIDLEGEKQNVPQWCHSGPSRDSSLHMPVCVFPVLLRFFSPHASCLWARMSLQVSRMCRVVRRRRLS